MKDGWDQRTIGELCEVVAGQSPKATFYNDQGDGLPFYQGKKEFTERRLGPPTTWTTQVTKEAEAGDILMSVRAPVGPINEATQRMCIGRGLAAIRAGSELERDYLWYALLWLQPKIKGNAGAVFESINKAGIEALSIPLPPLEEQQRIVAVLDEAFEGLARARAHAHANLQNAQEMFESALRSVFTVEGTVWDQEHLPDVCIDFGRGKSRHRPRNDPTLYGGDIPFVQTGDIAQANHFITDFKQTYSDAGLAQSKLWPRDTVCVAIVGATIGESGILAFDACFPDSVIGMTADPDKADPEYIEFLLQFVKAELKEAGKGSARDNINLGTFSDRRFPVPSVAQQAKVVNRLNQLHQKSHDLVGEYTGKLESLDDLRQSLLQKAFAGELT